MVKSDTTAGQLDISLWLRLTFGEMYPPVEVSSGQEWCYSGQLDIWSAFGSG